MRLIFLGPPGAGKGTQATILAKQWDVPHISTGEILRQAIAAKTELGLKAEAHVASGELVPDGIAIALMRERFGQQDAQKGWILDGFPRNVPQAHALDQLLEILGQPYGQVINFKVSKEALVKRLLERGRKDDEELIARKRLDVYEKETLPLIEFYKRRRCLIATNGNKSVEEIAFNLKELVAKEMQFRVSL